MVASRRRSGAAGAALVSLLVVGAAITGTILGGHALRVHGVWWWASGAILWMAAAAVGIWWTRGDAFGRYRLIPIRIAGAPGDAYRAGAPPLAARAMSDLEQAWLADGLAVYRKDGEVIVLGDRGEARVPVTDDERVGGAPLELRSDRLELVERLARAGTGVLGETTLELVDERKRSEE